MEWFAFFAAMAALAIAVGAEGQNKRLARRVSQLENELARRTGQTPPT